MPIHSIFAGNLVTTKNSRWQFSAFDSEFPTQDGAYLRWSYGTPYTTDTVDDPALPTAWTDAGAGWISDEITFPLAAPYVVRVTVADEPFEGEDDLPPEDPCPIPSEYSHPGLPENFIEYEERGDAYYLIVYPGKTEIDDAPVFLAREAEGYLPFKFTVYGMGGKVYLNGEFPITLILRVPNAGTLTYSSAIFTRNQSGIDDPQRQQENGQGPTYNVYLPHQFLHAYLSDLPNDAPSVQRDPISAILAVQARPAREYHMHAMLASPAYRSILFYIDSRPELLHFHDAGVAQRRYSMTKSPFARAGRTEFRSTTKHVRRFQHNATNLSYRDTGEFRLAEDNSSADFKDVSLRVRLKDVSGIWWFGYHEARVVAATRGNAGVIYYKLRTNDLPMVLRGQPLCIVRRNLSGRVAVNVNDGNSLARVFIAGLESATSGGFDYAGVASSVLAATAAVVVTVSTPWGVAIAVGAGLFGIWWAYAPSTPAHPDTAGQVAVTTSFLINDADGVQKVPVASAVKTTSLQSNMSRRPALDVAYNASNHTLVGDLVRVEQTYLASTFQSIDDSYDTRSEIDHRGFARALKMGAHS